MVVICDLCYGEFATERDLERHRERKIPCNAGEHKCDGCGLGYKTKKSLQDHKKRCKGKTNALLAHEQALEIEQLRNRVATHAKSSQVVDSASAAAVIARELSIVNLKLECNMTIIYQVGESFYTGNLLGEHDICESRNPDQLEIRHKTFSPQLYHKLKGDYLYFKIGLVASMLAVAALYRCVRSVYLFVQLESERKKIQ